MQKWSIRYVEAQLAQVALAAVCWASSRVQLMGMSSAGVFMSGLDVGCMLRRSSKLLCKLGFCSRLHPPARSAVAVMHLQLWQRSHSPSKRTCMLQTTHRLIASTCGCVSLTLRHDLGPVRLVLCVQSHCAATDAPALCSCATAS